MTAESEQKLLEALAPDKWIELSNAVKSACLNARTVRVEFEESPNILITKRVENGWVPKILTLTFNTEKSRIEWKCCDPHLQQGLIDIKLYGKDAFFVERGINRPLPDLVFVLTSCITRT